MTDQTESSLARAPFPRDIEQLSDLRTAIERYVLPGYVPKKPLFARNARMVTMGSCFAEHVHESLRSAGIQSHQLWISDGTNSPIAVRKFVEHLLGKIDPRDNFSDVAVEQSVALLQSASAFILTLGVSMATFLDGEPVRAWKRSDIREGRLQWRMLSVEEIVNEIRRIVHGLREIRPALPIFLTLSPIPLNSSLTHPSVFGADCLSKSLMRVAIETVLVERFKYMYYWPSFEMVRWLGGHVGPFFGKDGADARHLSPRIMDLVAELFIERFFAPAV